MTPPPAVPVERQLLTQAAQALRRGEAEQAQVRIRAALQVNPRSVAAWALATRAAETDDERRACLRRILEIDPRHAAARRHLARLQAQRRAARPRPPKAPRSAQPEPRAERLLLAPFLFLLNLPLGVLAGGALVIALLAGFSYYTLNTDLMGLAAPTWDRWTVSPPYEEVHAENAAWTITYEAAHPTQFRGLVRHVSPIRKSELPFLTHDILVTTGHFSNPAIVRTRVSNQRFSWRGPWGVELQGSINLLHTVVFDPEVYEALLRVRKGDQVIITGREILHIRIFDAEGNSRGMWRDAGCNTLLVTGVEIR